MGIRYKVERKQANAKNDWLCKECQSIFRTRADLFKHRKDCHNTGSPVVVEPPKKTCGV